MFRNDFLEFEECLVVHSISPSKIIFPKFLVNGEHTLSGILKYFSPVTLFSSEAAKKQSSCVLVSSTWLAVM